MLEGLFGNCTIEKILFSLLIYGDGYATGMAKLYDEPVNKIQQQLKRLENSGIVASRLMGRTRIYTLNPGYPFLNELSALLEKAFQFLPESGKEKYYRKRTRPRRPGKPE
jgi:DNA-binding transcriptional ArsR family regulator